MPSLKAKFARKWWVGGIITIALPISLMLGLATGSYDLSWSEILSILTGADHPQAFVIWQLRLPRVLLGFLTGAILTLGGFYMQALIKNPLADPYIMGLTAGAGLGVNVLILGLVPIATFSVFTMPAFAGVGAILSLGLVLFLGMRSFQEDSARLLIAGVAVASICTAITGILIYKLADSDQVRRMVFWSFGSLAKATPLQVWIALGIWISALAGGLFSSKALDLLITGDMQAQALGLLVWRFKIGLLLLTSVTVGGVVAFTGPIGFIGMMIPHFSRALLGARHRPNLIWGSIFGGGFLTLCDVFSRWLIPPAGLPIGIITAVLGVPFFLYLLFQRKTVL
ncbi:MAG: iron ABC transporter permease [Bacteroidota bacterium]